MRLHQDSVRHVSALVCELKLWGKVGRQTETLVNMETEGEEERGMDSLKKCSAVTCFPCACPVEGCHRIGEDWISSLHPSKTWTLTFFHFSITPFLSSDSDKGVFVWKRCIWLFFKLRAASDSGLACSSVWKQSPNLFQVVWNEQKISTWKEGFNYFFI